MTLKDYHFAGQKTGESVILLIRRHWITVIWPLIFTGIVFIVPLFVLVFAISSLAPKFFGSEWFWVATLVWTLFGVFFVIYNWLDWYLDIFLVTSLRIIDITQNGLFHRQVGETPLDNVQDVIYEIKGIVPMILNFGNVTIHTAGPSGNIVFEEVARPQEVQRFLLNEVDAYKDANSEKHATPGDLLQIMLAHERNRLLTEAGNTPSPEGTVPTSVQPLASVEHTLPRLEFESPTTFPDSIPDPEG